MKQNQTVETNASVVDFLEAVVDETKKNDSYALLKIFQEASGFPPKMWGPAIIGFGSYHYKYESGREGDAPIVAFSPRKDAISLYLSSQFKGRAELLSQFGKHKTAKSCIYIKKLADISTDILHNMILNSASETNPRC